MKFSKIVLAVLLILAVTVTAFACAQPEDPGNGGTTTTTAPPGSGQPGSGGSGGGQPGSGGSGNGGSGSGGSGGGETEDSRPGELQFRVLTGSTCEISGYIGRFESGTVEVPATYTDSATGITYNVTQIGAGAFLNCASLTSFVVPNTIEKIGIGAFEGCDSLATLTLPFIGGSNSSETYIGHLFGAASFTENADYVPSSLKTVILTEDCVRVPAFAFDACESITEVRLHNLVEAIGAYAFANCAIAEIEIPDSVLTVGVGAYAHCPATSLTAPFIGADPTAKVGHIGHFFGAADYHKNAEFVPATLANVTVTSGCEALGDGAFYGCSAIASPNLPLLNIKTIGKDAFTGTAYLNNKPDGSVYVGSVFYTYKGELPSPAAVTINPGTISIAGGAFENIAITSVDIPNTVVSIGAGAFRGTSLDTISLPFVGESRSSRNNYFGYIFGAPSASENGAYIPATLETVVLDENCTAVADRAFYGCDGLTGVQLGAAVSSVAKNAFTGCAALTAFTVDPSNTSYMVNSGLLYNKNGSDLIAVPMAISGSVTLLNIETIGEGQFRDCVNLTGVVLPSTLTTIEKNAFDGAEELASFGSFPVGLSFVGYDAYRGTAWYEAQANGLVQTGGVLYRVKGAMAEITVPAGVVYITEGAFEETGATKATLSSTVQGAGAAIFRDCTGMTELTLPFVGASVNEASTGFLGYMFGAGSIAISNRYIPESLTKVTLLPECTKLHTGAFASCINLSDITFPSEMTFVAGDALDATPFLKNQEKGTILYIAKILYRFFPTDLTYKQTVDAINNTPANEEPIENVYDVILRPDTIAIADNAFTNTQVHSVRMPDSTTYIGKRAFYGCNVLETVRVSSALATLSERAFFGCTSLTEFFIPETVLEIGTYAFADCRSMKKVYIQKGVQTIGNSAFENCNFTGLGFVSFSGAGGEWLAIDKGSGNTALTDGYRAQSSGANFTYVNPPFEVSAD